MTHGREIETLRAGAGTNMTPIRRTRVVQTAFLPAILLLAAYHAPTRAAQDSTPRESRDPTFVRVDDDGKVVVKQDGRERAYTLIGVEWPDAESHRDDAAGDADVAA